jgi:hypothetical protein
MGLNTSHNCFSGSYHTFHALRAALADAAGLPPLDLMQGFLTEELLDNREKRLRLMREARNRGFPPFQLPFRWDDLPHDVLHVLLRASDCDGSIPHAACLPLSERLMELAPRVAELPVEEEPDDVSNEDDDDVPGLARRLPAFPASGSGAWERAMITFSVARFAAGLKDAHDAGEDVQFW